VVGDRIVAQVSKRFQTCPIAYFQIRKALSAIGL